MRISRPGSSAALPQSLVLIGTGKLGGAMLEGWLRIGIDPKGISPIDPKPSDEMVALANEKGMRLNPSAKEIPPADVVVIATKPQMLDTAAPAMQAFLHPWDAADLDPRRQDAGRARGAPANINATIRAMPNLPAAVQRGAGATADALLGSIGKVEWLDDEGLIDAMTAVSGSGPAWSDRRPGALNYGTSTVILNRDS